MHFDEAMVQDHIAVDEDQILAVGDFCGTVEYDGAIEATVFMPDVAHF